MTELRVVALRGLPASGKSTYARRELAAAAVAGEPLVRVSRDDLRRTMLHTRYRAPEAESEALITRVQTAAVTWALVEGWSVIVDDTNIRREHLDRWRVLAHERRVGFAVVDHFLQTRLEDCIRRDARRPESCRVGAEVIRRMHAQLTGGARP